MNVGVVLAPLMESTKEVHRLLDCAVGLGELELQLGGFGSLEVVAPVGHNGNLCRLELQRDLGLLYWVVGIRFVLNSEYL